MKKQKSEGERQSPCGVPLVTSIRAVSPKGVLTLTHAPAWACRIVSTSSGFIPIASSVWYSLSSETLQNAPNQSSWAIGLRVWWRGRNPCCPSSSVPPRSIAYETLSLTTLSLSRQHGIDSIEDNPLEGHWRVPHQLVRDAVRSSRFPPRELLDVAVPVEPRHGSGEEGCRVPWLAPCSLWRRLWGGELSYLQCLLGPRRDCCGCCRQGCEGLAPLAPPTDPPLSPFHRAQRKAVLARALVCPAQLARARRVRVLHGIVEFDLAQLVRPPREDGWGWARAEADSSLLCPLPHSELEEFRDGVQWLDPHPKQVAVGEYLILPRGRQSPLPVLTRILLPAIPERWSEPPLVAPAPTGSGACQSAGGFPTATAPAPACVGTSGSLSPLQCQSWPAVWRSVRQSGRASWL
eukprot:3933959-Rhodomonas_salina.2